MIKLKNIKPLHWFVFFNFVIFSSVFTCRILRDSFLFTIEGSTNLLPLVFIINAFVMTWVGGGMENWVRRFGRKRFLSIAFGGAAIFFACFGILLSPFGKTIIPIPLLFYKDSVFIAFIFYLLSEIPIFLSMNIIWILAVDYFNEQQGQQEFPVISGIGLFGISFGAVITLSFNHFGQDLYSLNFFVAVMCLVMWLVSRGILKYAPSLRNNLFENEEDEAEETADTFFKSAGNDFNWVKKYKFLWLFTIVTVCNFFLLAVFDQTLAFGAESIGIENEELAIILAWWMLGFGIFAGLFQLFGFSKLLRHHKFGVGKMNLFAPRFMLAGALAYLLFASDGLDPIWASIHIKPIEYLLYFLIGARICGWIAEFLFNQSMLPFVYGALPTQDENRARFFIEGPVTAITNGSVGIFLLFYFQIFREQSERIGYKLDLLFVIALVAAILMFLWSKQMIPLFKEVLKKRVTEGEKIDKDMLVSYRPQLADEDITDYEEDISALKRNTSQFPRQLKFLSSTLKDKAVPMLEKYSFDFEIPSINRASAIKELVYLNAIQPFTRVWAKYQSLHDVPEAGEIEALGEAAKHFGLINEMTNKFEYWLNHVPARSQTVALLRFLGDTGLGGALIIGDYIKKRSEKIKSQSDEKDIHTNDFFLMTAELGSDFYYWNIAEIAGEGQNFDWKVLSSINFNDHEKIVDVFSLLLNQIEFSSDEPSIALVKLLKQNTWLCWAMIWILDLTEADIGENIRTELLIRRSLWAPLLSLVFAGINKVDSEKDLLFSNIQFFERLIPKISDEFAPELQSLGLDTFSEKNLRERLRIKEETNGIDFLEFLLLKLESPGNSWYEAGIYLSYSEALYYFVKSCLLSDRNLPNLELTKSSTFSQSEFRKTASLAYIYSQWSGSSWDDECWENHALDWLNRRRKQWLKAYILILGCTYTDSILDDTVSIKTADHLLDENLRDNMISRLEQSLPNRKIFTELRDDIIKLHVILQDKTNFKNYIGSTKIPRDRYEAREFWLELSRQNRNDLLLTAIVA